MDTSPITSAFVLDHLSRLADDFGKLICGIRVAEGRIYAIDQDGKDITYTYWGETREITDRQRFEARSEAVLRGWSIR